MRALVQRVSEASVSVGGDTIGSIGPGLLIFVCAMRGDPEGSVNRVAQKICKLRIFPDEEGRMNLSLLEVDGCALVVSQFTLAADTSRGNRPGFSMAADPQEAEERYQSFIEAIEKTGTTVKTGKFGADMAVSLVNDGPVTIWIDSES